MNGVIDLPRTAISRAEQNLAIQRNVLDGLAKRLNDAERDGPTKYQVIAKRYQEQHEVVEEAIERVDRLRSMDDEFNRWRARASSLREDLRQEYRGRGPQYDIIIDRLVAAVIRAEQTDESGRSPELVDWRATQRTVLEATAALQRYTESTKSEAMQTVRQQAMVLVLEVCERVIGKEQPDLWRTLLGEIERQLPAGQG